MYVIFDSNVKYILTDNNLLIQRNWEWKRCNCLHPIVLLYSNLGKIVQRFRYGCARSYDNILPASNSNIGALRMHHVAWRNFIPWIRNIPHVCTYRSDKQHTCYNAGFLRKYFVETGTTWINTENRWLPRWEKGFVNEESQSLWRSQDQIQLKLHWQGNTVGYAEFLY